jgi:hypothetical protein
MIPLGIINCRIGWADSDKVNAGRVNGTGSANRANTRFARTAEAALSAGILAEVHYRSNHRR